MLVREQALKKSGTSASGKVLSILNKVVGVSDLYAWAFGKREFIEIPVQTIKKDVSDDANAEKEDVEISLEQFVGKLEYECDDESDAVSVGVSYLIQHGMIDSPYAEQKNTTKRKR